MDNLMEAIVNKGLLQYAVGRKMFCNCGTVLDMDKAVLVSVDKHTGVCCAKCFDAKWAQKALALKAEVIDGRKLKGVKAAR